MNSLANRYASALLSLALDENKNAEYREYIKELIKIIKDDDSLINLLSCANISKDEKKIIIDKILVDCPYPNIINLLKVIIDNNRSLYLKDVLNEFVSISNEKDDISEGFIYVYKELDEKEIEKITRAISSRINKKVYLIQKVDESLLGGFKVVINDYVFDASILNKLEQLKHSLLERR